MDTKDNTDHNKDYNFHLDPSIFNLEIVKRIGIDTSNNCLIVEVYDQIALQDININAFSDRTILPLRKQLNEILINYKEGADRQRLINSIITCINSNVEKMTKYCSLFFISQW